MLKYFVYVLKCKDDSFYIGVTNNIDNRMIQHNSGIDDKCYTYSRRPVVLVYSEDFQFIDQAIEREKQLKGWSRKKKEALITEKYEKLSEYARKKFKW